MPRTLPTRRMSEHPDLAQLKRQAKELLQAFLAGETGAATEVNASGPGRLAQPDTAMARSATAPQWVQRQRPGGMRNMIPRKRR